MATIGTFRKTDAGFEGFISTLTLRAEVIFQPVESKSNEKAPDYRLYARTSPHEIGAAWHTASGENGHEYLSVKLDDPSFTAPIQCRLVKTGAEHGHSLLWDRPRKRS
jgi:uncharacterized protein (DUF736 family)